jgi:hypothetical protein
LQSLEIIDQNESTIQLLKQNANLSVYPGDMAFRQNRGSSGNDKTGFNLFIRGAEDGDDGNSAFSDPYG